MSAPTTAPARNTADLTAKLHRLKELYLEGDYSKEVYQRKKSQLQQQLAGMPPVIQRVLDVTKAAALLGDMTALVDAANPAEQRSLVHQVIDIAWIDNAGIRAIKPAPAYQLLTLTLARGNADGVTPTGLDPSQPTCSPMRFPKLMDALEVNMDHDLA